MTDPACKQSLFVKQLAAGYNNADSTVTYWVLSVHVCSYMSMADQQYGRSIMHVDTTCKPTNQQDGGSDD